MKINEKEAGGGSFFKNVDKIFAKNRPKYAKADFTRKSDGFYC